ncbi:Calcineurin subunit B [Astathelohania contejeani]|uniref:Calcineurin subunit B n=1 Tax=Astathelohania contejeani TaxID=164912 RepID=A0ABQ7HYU8_9MICR|nr:Calcineurin subunit B [Thelohania contejeani]
MGFLMSRSLCDDEVEELAATTSFTPKEILMLYERFRVLDKGQVGFITFGELMMLPEFHSNPFGGLLLATIEARNDYENMTFPYFLEIIEIFSNKSDRKERERFIFNALDLNGDGRICRTVLFRLFEMLVGDIDTELILYEIEKVMSQYDMGNKGYLTLKDFSKLYNSDEDIDKMMIIDLDEHMKESRFDYRLCDLFRIL